MYYFTKGTVSFVKLNIPPHKIFEFLVILVYGNKFPALYNENKL